MKTKKYWAILTIGITLYLTNNLILKNSPFISLNIFFNNYFNDILAPIVYLSYLNIISLILVKKELKSPLIIFSIIIICSFFWEFVALFVKQGSVFDPIDVISYFIGGLIFYIINYKKKNKTIEIY